ncbi:MAG: class I SAM-dependent methyltransferase [Elusimicrobia bacterium]|nr:class I SAM-dependent methyltransferase [Elusimicrobiota bacterium]
MPKSDAPPARDEALLEWLATADGLDVYAAALEFQTELHAVQTRAVLRRLAPWRAAKTVLDAGCGPGAFPARFARFLKGKRYVGVDRERAFIARARAKLSGRRNLRFVRADLLKFRGSFDAVYLWAVLQHLPSVDAALQRVRGLLAPGGAVILMDSGGDEEMRLTPPVRSVGSMYAALRKVGRGRHDDCVGKVKRLAGRNGLRVAFEEPVRVPVASRSAKRKLVRYVALVSELLERFYAIRTDRRRLLGDLSRWAKRGRSRAVLGGGRWLMLVRDAQLFRAARP